MIVTAIDLRSLRNAEFLQFCATFSELVVSNDPVVLNVVVQHSTFQSKLDEMTALFKRERSSVFTQALIRLDERRDNAINGLTSVINGYCYHFDPDTIQAAKLLSDSLVLYGVGFARINLQSETSTVNGIVHDWETKPGLTTALQKLGLTGWLAELKTANQLFEQKYIERTREYGAANPDTMQSKRQETMVAYYELRKFLDANAIVNPSAAHEKLNSELNALIGQYIDLLKNRPGESTTEPTPVN
jgi:hypothetical protein